jgi:hypothetical protein
MHYRRRQQGRRLISEYVQKNEDRRSGKQYRQLFKSLFNRHTRPLDEVVLPDGTIVSDQRDLLDVLTDHMQTWHQTNTSDPNIDWTAVIDDPYYLSRESRTNTLSSLAPVPEHLLDAVNKSFAMHKDNHVLHSVMSDTLSREITFQDFCAEINKRANNKSPGPSGFTINMLKALPSSVLEQLFSSLVTIWKSTDNELVPTTWYTSWLCLIPKDKFGAPSLERIRPISLFEVIRKVWTSVLVTRITRVWKDLHIIHPSQYGYQPKVGTDTELLQLLNVIEDAQEHKKTVIMTSYDTAKAFDSVNKSFMESAWQRLGVPSDIARYLVQMDVQGDTIIKTPHSTYVRKKYGTTAFTPNARSTRTSAPSFRARDGIGQGDSPSATAWVAVYDILLHALDSVPSSYKFSIQDHQIQTVVSLAYGDDL